MALVRSTGGCPICGASHSACGPPTTTKGVDERMGKPVTDSGGELKLYDVTIGANKTQMRLNEKDAAFYQEHHTATLAEEGSGDRSGEKPTAAKSRTASNKLGGAENK